MSGAPDAVSGVGGGDGGCGFGRGCFAGTVDEGDTFDSLVGELFEQSICWEQEDLRQGTRGSGGSGDLDILSKV